MCEVVGELFVAKMQNTVKLQESIEKMKSTSLGVWYQLKCVS
jgi:hypothetical protein